MNETESLEERVLRSESVIKERRKEVVGILIFGLICGIFIGIYMSEKSIARNMGIDKEWLNEACEDFRRKGYLICEYAFPPKKHPYKGGPLPRFTD